MYFVYILHSNTTDRFYVGHTEELQTRFAQHNNGRSRSTKSGIPWDLLYHEEFLTRSEAMKREKQIKSMKSREYIHQLIKKKR
jgi:putative endonuclease